MTRLFIEVKAFQKDLGFLKMSKDNLSCAPWSDRRLGQLRLSPVSAIVRVPGARNVSHFLFCAQAARFSRFQPQSRIL